MSKLFCARCLWEESCRAHQLEYIREDGMVCDDFTPADMIDEVYYVMDLADRAAEYEKMMEDYSDGNSREIY